MTYLGMAEHGQLHCLRSVWLHSSLGALCCAYCVLGEKTSGKVGPYVVFIEALLSHRQGKQHLYNEHRRGEGYATLA
jgi:hypothetical protein